MAAKDPPGVPVGTAAEAPAGLAPLDRLTARRERVDAGLDELDRWLRDQVAGGLAGMERAGYRYFDEIAARMVDAQAPGIARMLRALPASLVGDRWPARMLERLAAIHLLSRAHRQLDTLPADLAATVRSRVGYSVRKVDVLASAGVVDDWVALGAVDTVEYRLETRRVWLYGARTRRWASWLTFAPPGQRFETTVRPGQVLTGSLHWYPGSGQHRVLIAEHSYSSRPPVLPAAESMERTRRRFAELLAADPWASRLPTVLRCAAAPPDEAGASWTVQEPGGSRRRVVGLGGEPWPLLARTASGPAPVFGEWTTDGFQPISILPAGQDDRLTTRLAA